MPSIAGKLSLFGGGWRGIREPSEYDDCIAIKLRL